MKQTLEFKTRSIRKIPNPFYMEKEGGILNCEMYIMICDVKDVPRDIPMETNPREQKLNTAVGKKIRKSLMETSNQNFYLLNRGLLLSAASVVYNNKLDTVTVKFEDSEVHGDIDGGHTYKVIQEMQDKLNYGEQYVKIEILTGVEEMFQELAAARNTSIQVQDKSIAELEKRFQLIKEVIEKEPYFKNIYFKENDKGEIDVSDILAILNMFNLNRYPNLNETPSISYTGKNNCLRYYIEMHRKYANTEQNPYVKMKHIIQDILKLYDQLGINMKRYYCVGGANRKYGAIKGITMRKEANPPFYSKFYQKEMDYLSPNGFLYPILGAFRALLKEKDGFYEWKEDPFALMERMGPKLVSGTIDMSRELGNNPNATGKNKTLWMNLYMMIMMETMRETEKE